MSQDIQVILGRAQGRFLLGYQKPYRRIEDKIVPGFGHPLEIMNTDKIFFIFQKVRWYFRFIWIFAIIWNDPVAG